MSYLTPIRRYCRSVAMAKYPPIDPDTVRFNESRRNRQLKYLKWQTGMLRKETVEEKLMELNMPRKYGWFVTLLSDQSLSYDSWELIKYVTRTHVMAPATPGVSTITANDNLPQLQHDLPDVYYAPELMEKVQYYREKLGKTLHDIIMFEKDGIERIHDEEVEPRHAAKIHANSMVNQISRLITQTLAPEVEYLRKAQIDRDPKIEAFWIMGGFARSESRKKMLKNMTGVAKTFCQLKEDDPVERHIQYNGSSIIQIRSDFPLGPFLEQDHDVKTEPFNYFPHEPRNYEIYNTLRFVTNNSGHWSGCLARSNLLSIHSTHHLLGVGANREHRARLTDPNWIARIPSLLDTQAILVSFAKLVAQAYTLGFNQFSDLHYPLSTQTVLTNGLDWSFYTYQLNTFKLDGANIKKNNKHNICWRTKHMKIITDDGRLNFDVVDNLLKFYLRPSLVSPLQKFHTPYIKKRLGDIDDVDKRDFIFYNFQEMYSQKKTTEGYETLPEIYQWEKFYKIDNKTMHAEPRRRHFELPTGMGLDADPYKKPYKLRDPKKIPSMLRKLRAAVEVKREEERIEAAKVTEKAKYTIVKEDKDGETQ